MTAPERRRPLPALAFIGALTLLTALVWFRVIHRGDTGASASGSSCPSPSSTSSAPAPALRELPAPSKVSVAVLNSTQRNGIANATKRVLTHQGFHVTLADDDLPAYGGHGLIKGVAEIRYGPSAAPEAKLLSYFFRTATLTATDSSSGVVIVSLGAKFKSVSTLPAVYAALRKAHIKLTTSPLPTPTPTPSPSC
jgi:hypothetical protein